MPSHRSNDTWAKRYLRRVLTTLFHGTDGFVRLRCTQSRARGSLYLQCLCAIRQSASPRWSGGTGGDFDWVAPEEQPCPGPRVSSSFESDLGVSHVINLSGANHKVLDSDLECTLSFESTTSPFLLEPLRQFGIGFAPAQCPAAERAIIPER